MPDLRPEVSPGALAAFLSETFFQMAQFGLAAAQAFVLGAIIIVLSLIQYRLFSTDVEY